ncbi:hypothetical protein [Thermogemmatispora sp.]|uniref:hypothetical protein n=1 Tax=Thermogemmatispora sp. TaxID=1968838 RepID=UPI001DD0387E|nr:hypothetical protein [Thermogemmatispora sp.]MBX5451929.1 hypothetical protein [Thermogemmatispora sp.]
MSSLLTSLDWLAPAPEPDPVPGGSIRAAPLRGELAAVPPTTDLQTEPQRCNRLILFKVLWSGLAHHPERVGQRVGYAPDGLPCLTSASGPCPPHR